MKNVAFAEFHQDLSSLCGWRFIKNSISSKLYGFPLQNLDPMCTSGGNLRLDWIGHTKLGPRSKEKTKYEVRNLSSSFLSIHLRCLFQSSFRAANAIQAKKGLASIKRKDLISRIIFALLFNNLPLRGKTNIAQSFAIFGEFSF